MEQESFKILEYKRILSRLREKAGTTLGKELAGGLLPSGDREEVRERLQQTAEAVYVSSMAQPPLGGIKDIRESIKKVGLGAVLAPDELLDILTTMYAMREMKRFFKELEAEAPILKNWARSLEILGQLEKDLEHIVDEHGNLRDDASVELKRIRREIRSSQAKIKDHLAGLLHNNEYQKYFQEAIVTMRGDRYVLPVKQEYRQHFPGIVHDQSATGSTLFIEPMAVVNLNNDIKQLTAAERHEVERILRAASQKIRKNDSQLMDNCEIMAQVDFAFAKANLAYEMKATEPVLNEAGVTKLMSARHPLLPPDKVVPIDITIGDSYSMLLVTGPNTGGKTVSMKTFGLLVLMAQSGLFLPVESGSEIAVYSNIYADIGDEQSIEQSLSTFSAHMTHLVSILDKVEPEDLVLLDELGAGTDPEEGAALAMAILERLLTIKATVLATTHYSELKTFAFGREGIENACVEFDVATLRPTYRLLIGIPGASNAFAISRRLGLSESLIIRAKQLIQADHAQFEQVINQLEKEKMLYEQMNADIETRLRRAEQMEAKAEAMRVELNQKKADILRRAKDEGAALVRRMRRESEEVISQLKEQFNDQGIQKRQAAIQAARDQINEAAGKVRPGIVSVKAFRKPVDLKTLEPGDIIYVTKLDQKGTVLSIRGKELEVQLGSLKTNVKARDCKFVEKAPKEKPSAKGGANGSLSGGGGRKRGSSFISKAQEAHRDIDIRGMMVDEAEMVLGKFLDDSVMAGLSQVLIIHGKGTGALRKGVHAYLKRHRNVASFNFADMSEGGTGATLVELQ
ncbi:MAG: endonuclease MutS2 [Anaerovibrio sp.]|uniref:endonuclease MutS2 n=1 Tax=Anaerovibrio sp. TaxID=1872532 RepID=UPI002E79F013|nr:endonuclease MutS2 [Anaerovibrio sp.]MBQ5920396.1 endonuclease MutS2 [Selenomonadaceae bacterium]MCI6482985.1 endonuclease MutS2 [Selenomonadaceae bacterium]MEE1306694.1 endonuclease MutS2 [Anaerovibrio sp.]